MKDLIKVSREELNELRSVEKKLTDQLKEDKLKMNQYKIFLNKQLTSKYNELERKDHDIMKMNKHGLDNLQYLQDKLDISVKDKLNLLEEQNRITGDKLMRGKRELDGLRDTYISKLNMAFNQEYKRLQNSMIHD